MSGRQYLNSGNCDAQPNAAHNAKFIRFGKGKPKDSKVETQRERKRDALELEKKSSYATANEDYKKKKQSIFGTGI